MRTSSGTAERAATDLDLSLKLPRGGRQFSFNRLPSLGSTSRN
jgi:hypothetical protein